MALISVSQTLPGSLDRLNSTIVIDNIAVCDGILGENFNGIAFNAIAIFPIRSKLYQLDRRRTDVQAKQGFCLWIEQSGDIETHSPPQKTFTEYVVR